ncbi:YueI family protein [Heyndrickxia ginsengihumi]|uniref:YueI family protein n=1 Tax=Heyndrickxia ginsengihumi TaxID=363870 RepID=UPI003D1A37F4
MILTGKKELDDYLQQGIYGEKELLPEERRKFLGTLRERIVLALTVKQVREKHIRSEVIDCLREHPKAKILLNGTIDYDFLSKYIQAAETYNIPFSIVERKDTKTDIGFVLAYDYAIDQENIYLASNETPNKLPKKKEKKKKRFPFLFPFTKK